MTPKNKLRLIKIAKIVAICWIGLTVFCVFVLAVSAAISNRTITAPQQIVVTRIVAITATSVNVTRRDAATDPVSTNTTAPTVKPTVRPTLAPVPTINATREYKQQLIIYLDLVQYDMQDFSDYNYQMAADPYLIFDEDWIWKVDISLDNMQHYFDLMAAISPVPPAMRGVHAWIKKLSPEMREFVVEYRRGVELIDADIIDASLEHLTRMTEYINNVMAEPGW